MYELTVISNNGTKKIFDGFDSVEIAKETARKLVELCGSVIAKTEITEYETISDEDYDGFLSNCHCDTYGFCGGTSCPHYWECHSK